MSKYAERFKKTATASLSNQDPKLEPNYDLTPEGKKVARAARYRVKIIRCTSFESRKKAAFFCATFVVTRSDNPAHPVGSTRSWLQDTDVDAGPGAIKGFLVATIGKDHRDAADADWIKANEANIPAMTVEALEDPTEPACENALAGREVDVEVIETITKEKKQIFNKHTWIAVKDAPAAA